MLNYSACLSHQHRFAYVFAISRSNYNAMHPRISGPMQTQCSAPLLRYQGAHLAKLSHDGVNLFTCTYTLTHQQTPYRTIYVRGVGLLCCYCFAVARCLKRNAAHTCTARSKMASEWPAYSAHVEMVAARRTDSI